MFDHFTRHPQSVDETYLEHMGVASSFGFRMIGAGIRLPDPWPFCPSPV